MTGAWTIDVWTIEEWTIEDLMNVGCMIDVIVIETTAAAEDVKKETLISFVCESLKRINFFLILCKYKYNHTRCV